jgi:hypothetical protein
MTGARKIRFLQLKGAPRRRRQPNQSGFAYLLALFMVLALIITSQTLLENLATQGRRMREQETIWRGEQCERAIRLYYHKTGHYPQTFDDLNSGLPELHFLRSEAEKNPMNKTDGSWRFIYINAAGQIIGSVKYATLQQMAIMDLNHGKIPKVMPGAVSASSLASEGQTGSNSPNAQQSGMNFGSDQTENPLAALKPTGPVDGPVVGGFLTGVAGKTDAKSLIVYKGGKKYLDWEFIWNPIEDQARAMQQQSSSSSGGGLLPGFTNLPGLPAGLTGTGTSPAGTAATPSAPGTTPSTSPQAPSSPTGAQPSPTLPDQNTD